jgi:hypothetical protein
MRGACAPFVQELSDGWSGSFLHNLPPFTPPDFSYGNLVSPDGSTNILVLADEFEVVTSDPAVSPTNRTWNTTARVTSATLHLDVVYSALIKNNEIDAGPAAAFSEALSVVKGTHLGVAVTGVGYLEQFVHYGDSDAPAFFPRRGGLCDDSQ